ncbi:B-cell receptor-associated protein 31-like [Zingiber officinale]|uniref:Endoplasmic reticulum transmembrane protein n=1 Tax=Zingiber officinale TaxID=94328 RepID=A0A8J5LB49_ZINOF|nr:B-cell receptor-associated protein 31-like [Zingiber officinale]KAG6511694.1 hypothetical protein ZIOFF_029771 [Zingiber officinale]
MIQLLFAVLTAEVAVALSLLFKTPLRKLVILALDRLKRGRGPVMVKTVSGTVLVVLSSSLYSMVKIRSRSDELGLTPTDQVLMSRHLLEASLMGYSLFLALIIDRLHHYVRELRGLRKSMEAVVKQNRSLEEAKGGGFDEMKARDAEIANLNQQVKRLQLETQERTEEAKAAELKVEALKKQSEDLLIEYDRLLEDNQNLQNQIHSIENHT